MWNTKKRERYSKAQYFGVIYITYLYTINYIIIYKNLKKYPTGQGS